MSFKKEKCAQLLILLILVILSFNIVYAQDNCNDTYEMDSDLSQPIQIVDEIDDANIEEKTFDEPLSHDEEIQPSISSDNGKNSNLTLFIVSDNPGTNILDAAATDLFNEHPELKGNVNLVVRSGAQVKDMEESEFANLLASCDGFIGEWVSTDVDAVLTSTLEKYPDLSNKELFLILEPPSGNINSESSSMSLIQSSAVNYNRIFSALGSEELINYFQNTKRGSSTPIS